MKLLLAFVCTVLFTQVLGSAIRVKDIPAPVVVDAADQTENVKPAAEIAIFEEYQEQFNRLHFEMNYDLRIARDAQSARIKVLNAQFISRLGFATTDIRDEQDRTYNMILARGLAIGNLNSPCIVEKNEQLAEYARIAGYEIASDAHLTDTEMTILTRDTFYPVVRREQLRATELQSQVVSLIGRYNTVTGLSAVAINLANQFIDANLGASFGQEQINQELGAFMESSNDLRGHVFERIDNIIRNFHILTTGIASSLNECT